MKDMRMKRIKEGEDRDDEDGRCDDELELELKIESHVFGLQPFSFSPVTFSMLIGTE